MSSEKSGDKGWDAQSYQTRHSYVFKHGEGLVDLLDPKPGERVLDLGCGSGQLTAKIAEAGATVIGIDLSPDMIEQARANYPGIDFEIGDATTFEVAEPVDAVFSNAVLHWVSDAEGAIARVHAALKPGGRFVMEMGGKGNTRMLLAAVREAAGELKNPWYYPSVAEYSALLEQQGFEVRFATLFDRPTTVPGENGLDDWLVMFGGKLFAGIGEDRQREIRKAVADKLRPVMYRNGDWIVDYRRLRVVAVKPSDSGKAEMTLGSAGLAARATSDHHKEIDEPGEEAPDSQQDLVFIDTARKARGVDNFLWRTSGDAPLIHRIADSLFGLVLSVFGLFLLYEFRGESPRDRILSTIIALCALAGGVWEFRNACKRRSHWTRR